MSDQTQYCHSRELTQDEWFELYQNTKRERDEAREDFNYAVDMAARFHEDADRLLEERDEQTAQMCQAIGYLSTIAEDCEAWLNGESDEPSMEFIKAVRDYARKAVNNA